MAHYTITPAARAVLEANGAIVSRHVNCNSRTCRHESHPPGWDVITGSIPAVLITHQSEDWPGQWFTHLETADDFHRNRLHHAWRLRNHESRVAWGAEQESALRKVSNSQEYKSYWKENEQL